jgi:hypothetical protein
MKTKAFIVLVLVANILYCQPAKKFDERIVKDYSSIGVLEAPFMIDELIEIYKKDSLVVKRVFKIEAFNRTEYTLYCYNVCADFFCSTLIKNKNIENKDIMDKMISEINYNKDIVKPKINWSNVFKTCQNCPFGEYPDERFFYFKFSILFMGEQEIKEMINYSNGEQWKYALMAIKGGDSFSLSKEEDYTQFVLDRRMSAYIIEKWKVSKLPEVQNLLAIYKSVN